MHKKTDFEVWLTVGLYGIAITEFDEPDGILQHHLDMDGILEWFSEWVEPEIAGVLEVGEWHLKGIIIASEDDYNYTVTYTMPA